MMTMWTAMHLRTRSDRGSLPLALLVSLIGFALAGLLVPIVLVHASNVRHLEQRTDALHGAESGLDLALGLIRDSVVIDAATSQPKRDEDTGYLTGDQSRLPCGPLTGTVDDSATSRYQVTIDYFVTNPLRDATTQMSCTSGYGVYFRDSDSNEYVVPNYARLTSIGSSATGATRTLTATYVVRTTSKYVGGGQLSLFRNSGGASVDRWCLDGGSDPKVGGVIQMRGCLDKKDADFARQRWLYLSNFTIQLAATREGDSGPADRGLCITESGSHSVKLATCPAEVVDGGRVIPGPANANQQWGPDDVSQFAVMTTRECLTANTSGKDPSKDAVNVSLTGCSGSVTDEQRVLVPTPDVGAGPAITPITLSPNLVTQLVNFESASRCLDITGVNINASYLILYPCKQTSNRSAINWNQKFTLVNSGSDVTWRTGSGGTTHCLTSPVTVGGYVRFTTCNNGAAQKWSPYTLEDRTWQSSTIVDSAGLCLSSGPSNDLHDGNYSKITVEVCDPRSSAQKWNADPNVERSALTDLIEQSGD